MAQLFSDKKIAYILILVCYREIDYWEEKHSRQEQLDMSTYKQMLIYVQEKLDFYLPFVKYMRMSKEEWSSKGQNLSQEDRDYMLGFAYYSRSINEWLPAKLIKDPVVDDYAEYLLHGRFKSACENSEKLTDDLMKEINIDVHNRMFTLIRFWRLDTDSSL